MNKSLSGLIIPALLMATAAHAEVSPGDTSATLSITGAVAADVDALCSLSASVSSLFLRGDVSNLINQGDNANNMSFVPLRVTGNEQCASLVEQGRLSYRFIGTADDVEGKALANTSTGGSAATGVAIGLFDNQGQPIDINNASVTVSQTASQGIGFQVVKLKGQTATAGAIHGVLTIDIERL